MPNSAAKSGGVRGRIICKETEEALPDLMVMVFELQQGKSGKPIECLGSTLTDGQGKFDLEINLYDKPPEAADQENLLLMIFAPTGPVSATNQTSTDLTKRLLHSTLIPRIKSGRSHALMIRLWQKQLDDHDLTTASSVRAKKSERHTSNLIKTSIDARKRYVRINDELSPVRRASFAKRLAIGKKAKTFAINLMSTPAKVRARATFVAKASESSQARHDAMVNGLSAMAEAGGDYFITFNATAGDLMAAGIDAGAIAESFIEVSRERICRLINARRGGTEFVRVKGLLEQMREQAEGEAGLVPDTPSDTDVPSTDETTVPEESAEEIRKRVLGQVSGLPVYGDPDLATNTLFLNAAELSEDLKDFRLGAGPSDTPAFHDFYRLQVAFEHVWTEAFDNRLREQVEDLYEEITNLCDDWDLSYEMPVELTEIVELELFLKEVRKLSDYVEEPPPDIVQDHFPEADYETWNQMNPDQRNALINVATNIEDALTDTNVEGVIRHGSIDQTMYDRGRDIIANAKGAMARLKRLLEEVATRLGEPYGFHYFEKDSVNFGILLTYRQLWEPGPYQVGDMVATIPLAPGETRKFTAKQTVKRTRAETIAEQAQASQRREITTTKRIEAEIVSKASMRTNFSMTSEGSINFAIGSVSAGSEFSMDQARESSRVKKDFREAVLKATQEYKQDHSLKVETSDEVTSETSTSGMIKNPNNEVTVTYLLYELERQYKISERIHRVTPIILVAQEMPRPDQINESWLITQEWILRRVILDDKLLIGLDYLTDGFAADEVSINVKKSNWQKQVALVDKLEATVEGHMEARDALREALIDVERSIGMAEAEEPSTGRKVLAAIFTGGMSLMHDDTEAERLKVQREAVEAQLEYLEATLKLSQEKLSKAVEALNAATTAYTDALEMQTNRRVAIDQLRIHVKKNILYYMQAIWAHEPPDQRFFRLYDVDVTLPEAPTRVCRLRPATDEDRQAGLPTTFRHGRRYVICDCGPPLPPDPENPVTKKLVEIADIDQPLGYKGNYILFPLKECIYLTEYMMHEFYDDYFGVRDPDEAANFTTEELVTYAQKLLNDPESDLSAADKNALRDLVMDRLQQPRRDKDLVVVPTGELYMEALVGKYALLEDFKKIHRGYDVAKARAELREVELDNLRKAARLLLTEPDLEDPDIDRHVVVTGDSQVHVDTP